MKSVQKRTYNLIITVAVFLFLIFSVTAIINITENQSSYAQENQGKLVDGFDFADNSVLVTMDKEVGGVNKVHDKSYFGDVAVTSVTDLTYRKNVANVDLDRFKQILKLELQYHDKNYVLRAVEEISKIKGVEAVTPNYYGKFYATANDTYYDYEWGLKGVNGIHVEVAWDITIGSKDVRVGVIDTGIAQHPNLNANLALGWNFVDNNDNTNDTAGHGTHVAGIIGADGKDNGISGVCKNVELVPLKISNVLSPWLTENVIRAITYADELWGTVDQIDLLNFSGGGFPDNINFFNAINNFRGLFVCGAGNDRNDIDLDPYYPASYDCDNIIVVGAIDYKGDRWLKSNYGKNTVGIYAPGGNIYSTVPYSYDPSGYFIMSGTSMAAPHVAGVAALMLSVNPDLTGAELKEKILISADDITISTPSGSQNVKKLNAYKAVMCALNYEVVEITFDQNGGSGGTTSVYATYGELLPLIELPTRTGYNFLGYYTSRGICYYEFYDSNFYEEDYYDYYAKYCDFCQDITLYAHWEPAKYWITFDQNGGSEGTTEVYAVYGELLPLVDLPKRVGYNFLGYFSDDGTLYYEFYDPNFYEEDYYYYGYFAKYCDFDHDITLHAEWESMTWNVSVWGYLSNHGPIAMSEHSFTLSRDQIKVFALPGIEDYDIESWTLTYMAGTIASGTEHILYMKNWCVGNYSDYTLTIKYHYNPQDHCIAAGTLITLADGSQKAVEELTGDEMLLTWNLFTGTYDYAPILFIDSEPIGLYKVIKLSFSDGTTVDVISEHGFWDVDLNKYVYLDEYAAEYIGHSFLKQGENGMTEVTLLNVDITTEVTTAYSPVTYGHLCYYVNGMLSMPGGIEGLFNIFEVDSETMMYDAEAMAADIEEHGLFTYEELNALVPVTEELFEAVNGQYLKVAVGKGIITIEQIQALVDRYSHFFE